MNHSSDRTVQLFSEEHIIWALMYIFPLIFIKLTIIWEVASLQLPAIYPQLPVLLFGRIETLIWRLFVKWFVNPRNEVYVNREGCMTDIYLIDR